MKAKKHNKHTNSELNNFTYKTQTVLLQIKNLYLCN